MNMRENHKHNLIDKTKLKNRMKFSAFAPETFNRLENYLFIANFLSVIAIKNFLLSRFFLITQF